MNNKYDWNTILTAPAFFALISAIILNFRLSLIELLFNLNGAENLSVLLYLVSILILTFIALIFPAKIGYAVSEKVSYSEMLNSSMSGAVYPILTFIAAYSISSITSKYTNSPYIISSVFLVDTSRFFGNGLSIFTISLIFIIFSTFSAFVGAFRQIRSMK